MIGLVINGRNTLYRYCALYGTKANPACLSVLPCATAAEGEHNIHCEDF
ncbi:MAG: hypothetical protein WCI11_13070 [Candidatus Methylumidiphilus sp.]